VTPDEEAEFIAWWREGLSLKDIAARLGIPPGTVSSRAAALRRQGVALDKRPQGGAYPSQRAKTQHGSGTGDGVSGQTPEVPQRTPGVPKGVSTRVSKPVPVEVLPSSPAPSGSPEMTPLLQEILQELRTLTRGLAVRVSDPTPQVSHSTPQVPNRVSERVSSGVSIGPHEKTERWNLHLPIDLITKTKAKTQALGVHPSELVAEVLRQWLTEEDPS
jgi:DNA-binding Lrp family transcriptional regulator